MGYSYAGKASRGKNSGNPKVLAYVVANPNDYIVIGDKYCIEKYGEPQDNWNEEMEVCVGLTALELQTRTAFNWNWEKGHFVHKDDYKGFKVSPIKQIKIKGV